MRSGTLITETGPGGGETHAVVATLAVTESGATVRGVPRPCL